VQYFFLKLLLPSCFHHATLPLPGSSDGGGPGSDFLPGWGLPPLWDAVVSHTQGMCWVRCLLSPCAYAQGDTTALWWDAWSMVVQVETLQPREVPLHCLCSCVRG